MIAVAASAATLTGCTPTAPAPDTARDRPPPEDAEYLGVEPVSLGEEFVLIELSMRGARDRGDAVRYADCAIAGYGLREGWGYARPIRTSIENSGGLWTGDAVYTVSPERPEGVIVIDAADTAETCEENGIPTV